MPNYTFRDEETGELFEEFLSISDKEQFLKDMPNVKQVLQPFDIIGGVGGIKTDDGWKEMLSRVAEAHPSSHLAKEHGKKDPKTVSTRNAIERWKKQNGRV